MATTKRFPAAGGATGNQEKQPTDTTTVSRCDRCDHKTSSRVSRETGLGCDCRKIMALSAGVADRLIELANSVDTLPLPKLRIVSKALDQVEVSR